MEKTLSIAFSGGALLIGAAFVSTGWYNRAEYETASFVGAMVFGGLFLALGFYLLFAIVIPEFREGPSLKKELKDMLVGDQEGKQDSHPTEKLITQFKETYRAFFAAKGVTENSTLQNTTTQMYWHILFLQKNRLERKGVTLDFSSVRKRYGGKSVERNTYHDNRFSVTEVKERIAALREYRNRAGGVYRKKNAELAHYAIVNARTTTSENKIVCPNCGNATTRENLLDGCDFCGTKFTVEDLGKRVSSFVLRDDYQTMLDKYEDAKTGMIPLSRALFVLPFFLFNLIGMLSAWNKMEAGFFMKVTAVVLGVALLTAIPVWLSQYVSLALATPLLAISDFLAGSYTKKRITGRRQQDEQNVSMVFRIREGDSNFSRENFFSNVQNKLAAIHYADSAEAAQAFAETDISAAVAAYKDVVDMDVLEMVLTDARKDTTVQTVQMETVLDLLYAGKRRFRHKTERLALTLVRDAACKTEAVCAPSIFRCKNCGNSLTLLNGGRCEYCGSVLQLREYDWVIREYRVLK